VVPVMGISVNLARHPPGAWPVAAREPLFIGRIPLLCIFSVLGARGLASLLSILVGIVKLLVF
jgi:hypothetical protein